MKYANECIQALITLNNTASSYYDSRINVSFDEYINASVSLTESYNNLYRIIDNLGTLSSDSTFLDQMDIPGRSTTLVKSVSFNLPRTLGNISILAGNEVIKLVPPSRVFNFSSTEFDIMGSSIILDGVEETRHDFVLNRGTSDYADAGIQVDWISNTLVLLEDVVCVHLVNNRASRESGLFNLLSSKQFKYWSASNIADALNCDVELTNYDLIINVDNGYASFSEDIPRAGLLIRINGDLYVLQEDGKILTYIANTLPALLENGQYAVRATQSVATLKGQQVPLSFNDYIETSETSLIESNALSGGDIVTTGSGEVGVISSSGASAVVNVGLANNDITKVTLNTQQALNSLVLELPSKQSYTLPAQLTDAPDYISVSNTAETINLDIDKILSLVGNAAVPPKIEKILHEIKYVHLKAGFDNAYNYLAECSVSEYFNLKEHDKSYGSSLSYLTGDLSIKVQK